MDYKLFLAFVLTGFFSGSGVLAMNQNCINQNQINKQQPDAQFFVDIANLADSVVQTIGQKSVFAQKSEDVSDFLGKLRELLVQVDNSQKTCVDLLLKAATFSDADTSQKLVEAWDTMQMMCVNLVAHSGSIRQHILEQTVKFSLDVQNLYNEVSDAIKKQSNDINNFKKKPNVFLNLASLFLEIGNLVKRLEQLEDTGMGLLAYNGTRMVSDIIFTLEPAAVKIKRLRSAIGVHMSQIESLEDQQHDFNQFPAVNETLQKAMFKDLAWQQQNTNKALGTKMDKMDLDWI